MLAATVTTAFRRAVGTVVCAVALIAPLAAVAQVTDPASRVDPHAPGER